MLLAAQCVGKVWTTIVDYWLRNPGIDMERHDTTVVNWVVGSWATKGKGTGWCPVCKLAKLAETSGTGAW